MAFNMKSCCHNKGSRSWGLELPKAFCIWLMGFGSDLFLPRVKFLGSGLVIFWNMLTLAVLVSERHRYNFMDSFNVFIHALPKILWLLLAGKGLSMVSPFLSGISLLIGAWFFLVSVLTHNRSRSDFFKKAKTMSLFRFVLPCITIVLSVCFSVNRLLHLLVVVANVGTTLWLVRVRDSNFSKKKVSLDVSVSWMITLWMSWLYSTVLICKDICGSRVPGLYYLADVWKTLGVVIFNQDMKMQTMDVDDMQGVDHWLSGLLPWIVSYACLMALVHGYAFSMGLNVGLEILLSVSVVACPCVVTCVAPLCQHALMRGLKRGEEKSRLVPEIKRRLAQNKVLVGSYYIMSLFLSGGGSLWIWRRFLRPWEGALMMIGTQSLIMMNTVVRPYVLNDRHKSRDLSSQSIFGSSKKSVCCRVTSAQYPEANHHAKK